MVMDLETAGLDIPIEGELIVDRRAMQVSAEDAMRGDILRALVELITNSDDAYLAGGHGGRIDIEVDHARRARHNRVVVRDSATGMSLHDLQEKIVRVGRYHDDVDGRRGFFGQGAKDCAIFGNVLFESVHDDRFSTITIEKSMAYHTIGDRPVTAWDRARLKIPEGNGTVVTINVERATHAMPLHATLVERLSNAVQLRDIVVGTSDRRVSLTDTTRGLGETTPIVYVAPVWRSLIHDAPLNIPGYADAHPRLRIWATEQALPMETRAWRHSGVLIVGRRAVYDSTYFSLEGRSGSLWFSGRLDCPEIDDLQRQWEEIRREGGTHPASNPQGMVTRGRVGLRDEHPFTRAMAGAIEGILRPLVNAKEAEEAQKEASKVSDETRKRLRAAERLLGQVFAEVSKEEEIDIERGNEGSHTPVALEIIPAKIVLRPGEERTVIVRTWPEALGEEEVPDTIVANIEPPIALVTPIEAALLPDPREPRRRRAVFTVTALDEEDTAALEVTLSPQHDDMAIIVVEERDKTVRVPDRLTFGHTTYRLRPGRQKHLIVLAPRNLVEDAGATEVRLSAPTGIQHPGTVPLGRVEDDGGDVWYAATVVVSCDTTGRYRLRADAGDQSTVCSLVVENPEGEGFLRFDFRDTEPRYAGAPRWDFGQKDGVPTIWILTGHPTLRPYFGHENANQGSAECRALIAEVLAEACATHVLRKREERGVEGDAEDALRSYRADFNRLHSRFGVAAIRAMDAGLLEPAGPGSRPSGVVSG